MSTGEATTPDPDSELSISKSLCDELEQCRAEAQATRRELDSFLYAVAHELRAPLRSIIGFNQAISEDCAETLDAKAHGYLDRVQENAHRLEQMLDGLLLLSRVGAAKLRRQPVDLSELVRGIAAELLRQEPHRQVEFLIPLGLQAEGDIALLQLVVEHLIGNAWKFSAHQPQARIEFGVWLDASEQPVYFIRDNGAGFDSKYEERLFQPFQRLHAPSEFNGTGIGLALARRIIQRHGGKVWLDGAVGQGAAVYFTL